MNIKSLLLGSAAALAAVSGAQAADAIVAAEPEPMEYVRVCDAFGTGYFYIPGTETCLKIGGFIRVQGSFGEDAADSRYNQGNLRGQSTSDWDVFSPRSKGGAQRTWGYLGQWRRRRDSNPRYRFRYTPLAGERLRPLGHLSVSA